MPAITWLPADSPETPFPDVSRALDEPNGLLAIGGDLSPARLLNAYRHGIFPWYSRGEPILWWSPDPRAVIFLDRLRVSRRLARTLRGGRFSVTWDTRFDEVIAACAAPRRDADDTWILPEMIAAYRALHRLGHAHSIEVWRGDELVGGLYGVSVGRVFSGESMFSRVPDASKVALARLCERLPLLGYRLLDCQVASSHLVRMGAEPLSRGGFVRQLAAGIEAQPAPRWPDG